MPVVTITIISITPVLRIIKVPIHTEIFRESIISNTIRNSYKVVLYKI